jgi:hypothetical protein
LAEPEQGYSVTVIRRREITTWPKIGTPLIQVLVTYVAAGLPPGTVTMPKDGYNLEKEKAAIKADVQRRLAVSPESYRV